jgi:general secretion pathway protein M
MKQLEALSAYWQARDPRERAILLVGGIVAVILLLYLLVWDPIQSDRQRLVRDLPKLRAQVEQFRRDAEEAEGLRARAKSRGPGQSLQAAVESSAKQANLGGAIKSVQALGTERAQVSGASVPFDGFVRWIAAIAQSDGVSVDSIQASAAAEPGRLQVESLVLRR